MDHLSPEHRSWNMSRIRGKDTKPELVVRSILHSLGYRFRLHGKNLPGKPDIVLPRYNTVIFVHGCFWHRHKGCRLTYMPKTHTEFWEAKFSATEKRDRQNKSTLRKLGWSVFTVWECATADREALKPMLIRCLTSS